jgi:hypothetical protein
MQILITHKKENELLIIKGYDFIIIAAVPKNIHERASKQRKT